MGGDLTQEALQRIAGALESIENRQREENEARATKTAEDNRRELTALVTIGLTALLVVGSASNVASRIAPFAQQLKDYQPLFVVGLTIAVALIYRAFQLRVIPLEVVVGIGIGIGMVAAITLLPIVHTSWTIGTLALAVIYVFGALFDSVKWDFGAERAAVISAAVVLLILWAAGLITVRVGGAYWLQFGFVGETLLTIDSAFPKLALLDVLVAVALGLLFSGLYWRWGAFGRLVIKLGLFRLKTPDRETENILGIVIATFIAVVVMIGLVVGDPFARIAHMPWPLFG